jgi:hypothetical protein
MPTVTLPNGWTPRPYQEAPMRYMDAGGKRVVTIWHRRGGKDLTALHQTCKEAHKRTGVYWHIFPTAEQGRKAIWEGFTKDGQRILEQVFPRELRRSPREFTTNGEMVVTLKCGSIWRLLGSDKMEVVGAGPVGVVLSEYALAKPNTWDLIRPMLRENDGWAWFPTTPRGKNHAHKLFEMARADPTWFCDLKTLADTNAYDPVRTVAEEQASGMPVELIQQEYFCDFNAANVGSFYGVTLAAAEAAGRLADFEHGRDSVFTFWDLGRADDTSIWWMRPSEDGVEVLDHYASHGEDLEHYFDVIEERARVYGWRYRKHMLPHDARAKTLATKMSVLDQFIRRFGASAVGMVPELGLLDGIQAVRAMLLHPGTRIHPRCSSVANSRDCDGVEALRSYHREWDAAKKCFRETPVHDWSSHTADAFRYMAVMAKVLELLARPTAEARYTAPVPLAQAYRGDDLVPVRPARLDRIG